jgi:acetyl-CoA carboxylase biotin carboxyl carrier protein
MNKKEIEELIKFVSKSAVEEVNLETKDIKITIKNSDRSGKGAQQTVVHVPAPSATQAAPAPAPAPAPVAAAPPAAAAEDDESKYHVVKSPMIGTFYRASGPEKDNFVNVGDEVTPGKVVCIIEAMKLFNEIECDVAGKVVKVLVDNSSPVEYDQPLFLIDPA